MEQTSGKVVCGPWTPRRSRRWTRKLRSGQGKTRRPSRKPWSILVMKRFLFEKKFPTSIFVDTLEALERGGMVKDYNSNSTNLDSEDDEDPRTPASVSSQVKMINAKLSGLSWKILYPGQNYFCCGKYFLYTRTIRMEQVDNNRSFVRRFLFLSSVWLFFVLFIGKPRLRFHGERLCGHGWFSINARYHIFAWTKLGWTGERLMELINVQIISNARPFIAF